MCRIHVGQGRPKATERVIEGETRRLLARLSAPEPLGHPVTELLAIAAEAREWLRILRERVSELSTFQHAGTTGIERERALVSLYERALDRTGRLLADLVRLDLEEREVRLAEDQGVLIADLFIALFADPVLQLSEAEQDVARGVASQYLLEISSRV